MTTLLIGGRLLLAAVFAVAGVAKLVDRKGSRQAIVDFGLPPSLATPLGLLLPVCELAVAAALVPTATAWWGAVGALALLLVFVAGIGINLARGREPECHCFGQLHSAPAGWKTLTRNGALTLVAAFVVVQGRDSVVPSTLSWMASLPNPWVAGLFVLVLIMLGAVAGQWWFLMHLLKQNGRLLERMEALEARPGAGGAALSPNGNAGDAQARPQSGLAVGSLAPDFALPGLHEEEPTLESLRAAGKPVLLLFIDPNCVPCNALLPEVGRWQREHSDKLTISVISRGRAEENRTKAAEHGLSDVLLQQDWEVAQAYQVTGAPAAVLVFPRDGAIGSTVANGPEAIRSLVTRLVRPQAPVPITRKVGEVAPEVKLLSLDGEPIELKDFGGEQTLVLFWNPGCGFCQQMLPDLKEWEENPPESAPRLLVVSSGTEEANRELGLSSPLVLDQQFAAARAFGAYGTPSAVLVDAGGRIASEVALGAPAVLDLAGASRTEP